MYLTIAKLWNNISVLPHQAVAEHPVGEVLVVAPEVVDGVDHAGELALPGQLLVQPRARQPVGNVVILKEFNNRLRVKCHKYMYRVPHLVASLGY